MVLLAQMTRTIENEVNLQANADPRLYYSYDQLLKLGILSTIDPRKTRTMKEFIDKSVGRGPQLLAELNEI